MTSKPDKPINLSVHEISDPNTISPNPNAETSVTDDLNDSVHDDDNVDAAKPKPFETAEDDNLVDSQTMNANISAG